MDVRSGSRRGFCKWQKHSKLQNVRKVLLDQSHCRGLYFPGTKNMSLRSPPTAYDAFSSCSEAICDWSAVGMQSQRWLCVNRSAVYLTVRKSWGINLCLLRDNLKSKTQKDFSYSILQYFSKKMFKCLWICISSSTYAEFHTRARHWIHGFSLKI